MLEIRKSIFVDAEDGSSVLMTPGDFISEIEDAGPVLSEVAHVKIMPTVTDVQGWDVSFKFTPSHKQWTEIVTCDAVELLKSLEGDK